LSAKLFIFEGADGAGKTSQVERAAKGLRSLGYTVLKTRQPGGTEAGSIIRSILKAEKLFDLIPAKARRLLFVADAMIQNVFMKSLDVDIILCDRHCGISNAAYGLVEGCNLSDIRMAEELGLSEEMPVTKVFIINVRPGVGWDRTDHEDLSDRDFDTSKKVNHEYARMAEDARITGKVTTLSGHQMLATAIDGNGTPEETEVQIRSAILEVLE
jgi:dTMP kinase